MGGSIAVLNAGSSSIKFALYDASERLRFKGQVEQIGVSPRLKVTNAEGQAVAQRTWPSEGFDHRAATQSLVETAVELLGGRPAAVGHRVVHGGTRYAAPILVDAEVLAALEELKPLAPLH